MPHSNASLRTLSRSQLDALRARLGDGGLAQFRDRWRLQARPEQVAPEGDWTTWLFLGGRGAGKTRAGAEWIRERVETGAAQRIALVAATAADARAIMVEGESGILKISSRSNRPKFEPSKRQLVWKSGAVATLYSTEEPDSLRGPQHDTAWCDELAKWNYAQATWDNLQLSLRLGARPQQMVTTTPRPIGTLKAIMARNDSALTRGTTYDNRANLAPAFFAEVIRRYEGTRFGRQEIEAQLLEDVPGALWSRATLESAVMAPGSALPQLTRVVIGVDPSGTRGGDDRDSVGIVAAARGSDGLFYVLGDYTCALSPAGWGRRVAEAASLHSADCVVAEQNFGGAMVESVLQAANVEARVKMVTASRGKAVRAEPIAALYEQGRVRHAKGFAALEDQLAAFTTNGYAGNKSPDSADALIWALTELIPKRIGMSGWFDLAREAGFHIPE